MGEASRKWKYQMLQSILGRADDAKIPMTLRRQESLWLLHMIEDGLCEAIVIPGNDGVPEKFFNIFIRQPGVDFIGAYKADSTFSGIWQAHHKSILKWACAILASLIGVLIAQWLTK